jgi:hypothetical protein
LFRHLWQSAIFLLIPSQIKVFHFKNLNLRIGSAASNAGQGKLTLVYLPWSPREAGLSILTVSLLFRRVRKFGF